MFAVNFGLEYSTFVYPGYPCRVVDGMGLNVGGESLKPRATVRGASASLAVP
jgi:hypothetical protein